MKKLNLSKQILTKKRIKEQKSIIIIAKELNCSFSAIYKYLEKFNIYTKKKNYKISKKFLIKEYSKNIKSISKIAKEFGCSKSTIRNKLIKYNIPRRTTREALKGRKLLEQHRKNVIKGLIGRKVSKKTRIKISVAISGSRNVNFIDGRSTKKHYCIDCLKKGIKTEISWNAERCISCSYTFRSKKFLGKFSHFYIDGRTPLTMAIRHLKEYKQWRKEVFKRDNYTCQDCGQIENLEAHHKKEFHIILAEFLKEYDQFSPIEDKETLIRLAMKWKPFWDINNGKTLCEDCHKKIKVSRITNGE